MSSQRQTQSNITSILADGIDMYSRPTPQAGPRNAQLNVTNQLKAAIIGIFMGDAQSRPMGSLVRANQERAIELRLALFEYILGRALYTAQTKLFPGDPSVVTVPDIIDLLIDLEGSYEMTEHDTR